MEQKEHEIGDRVEVIKLFNKCVVPIGAKGTIVYAENSRSPNLHSYGVNWDSCPEDNCNHNPCTSFSSDRMHTFLRFIERLIPSPLKNRWELIFE